MMDKETKNRLYRVYKEMADILTEEEESKNDRTKEINRLWLSQCKEHLLSNQKLMDVVIGVVNLSEAIKTDEVRYFIFGSLNSSDNIVDINSANESLNTLLFIKKYIDLFDLTDELKKETMKYVNKGIKIVNEDIKRFEK